MLRNNKLLATGTIRSVIIIVVLIGVLILALGSEVMITGAIPEVGCVKVYADELDSGSGVVYKNPETGYVIVIEDGEDLLSEQEEIALASDMMPITEYGNVAFVSCYSTNKTTAKFANDWYYGRFGNDSGTAFVIDMYNRIIQIASAGDVYKVITKGYANTISDNIYKFASKGDYYGCASSAYKQEYTLLEGGRISRPMKHITNVLVALTVAIILNYLFARYQRRLEESPAKHVFNTMTYSTLASSIISKQKIKTVTYDESDLDDDDGGFSFGGGGFSGGGFSGGGGGFSGGGGGHSF